MSFEVNQGAGFVSFEVKVQPGSKKTMIVGLWEKALKIKVAKKPESGAANAECLAFLAHRLGISRKNLRIVKGEFTSRKVIRADGLSVEQVQNGLVGSE